MSSRVNEKKAGTITWANFADYCKGCGLCIQKCPKKCLKFSSETLGYYGTPAVDCDIDECIGCGICELNCPDSAIEVEKKKQ
ncbi:4Fe-4S ferredoxin [bacterium (Candidatus Howlettbacteria) CG_4_10_14_0_8_um_filter_40_9]|nr:MAG: 4Fe-4S ferredoxin [bacterium (Candidatus Howlettbacteria) CG_4_10_14_0_8_um_filter_40_9]